MKQMVINQIKKVSSNFVRNVFNVPQRLIWFLVLLLFVFFPIAKPSAYALSILTSASFMAIAAASWDLTAGFTGLFSFGHALFFGVGSYTTALLCRYANLQPYVSILIGTLCAVVAAVLVGLPSLRVKGPYLALMTMAFPIAFTGVIYYFRKWTGGDRGMYGVPALFPSLSFYMQRLAEYYLTFLLLFVSAIVLYKIAYSKTGMIFVSIHDDELGAKAAGVNVTKYKLIAFAISAFFVGLAGSVNAHIIRSANVGSLGTVLSFMFVLTAIFGGMGTIYGPIAAAYILQLIDMYGLKKLVDIPTEWHMLIYGAIIIVLMLVWPTGIVKFVNDKLRGLQKPRGS